MRSSFGSLVVCAFVLASATWMTGCSDDTTGGAPGGGGPGGSYTGPFNDSGGGVGIVQFAIPTAAPMSHVAGVLGTPGTPITGTVSFPGGSLPLTGTFDPATGALSLHSAKGEYQFTGTLASDGHFEGTCLTPGGTGSWVTLRGDGSTVQVFCGTYSRCNDAPCQSTSLLGTFNLALSGNTAVAAVYTPDGPLVVAGTVTHNGGTFLDFDFAGIHVGGEVTGSTVGGYWAETTPGGLTGVWSGSTAACQGTRR